MSLLLSAGIGHLPIVQYLTEKGSDIEAKSMNNNTFLHWAPKYDQIDAIKEYLIPDGANKITKMTLNHMMI